MPFANNSIVFLYTLSTCIHCQQAKKLLEECGQKYDFVEVDVLESIAQDEALNELAKRNPSQTFPTIIVGKQVIVGYHPEDIKDAVAKLA